MTQLHNVLKTVLLLLGIGIPVLLFAQEPIIDVHAHAYHNDSDADWSGPGLPQEVLTS